MKRNHFASLAVLAAALAFGVAHAGGINLGNTTNDNRDYSTTNHGGAGGTGVGVGVGVGVGIAGAASTSNAVSGGNTLGVTVQGDQNPVSSAIAPAMNTTANCAVAVSGGITAASWSISGGSAYESDTCVTIEQAKTASAQFNDRATGEAIMCTLAKYREGRKAADRPCAQDVKPAAAKTAAADASTPAVSTAAYTGSDPFVIKRLGLAK